MRNIQLFLLHFAGGNCYSFDFIKPWLADLNLVTLELPGRGRRMQENLLRSFDDAANDLYVQINNKLASPQFVIYGHSMGAYLGLRISNMLEKAGKAPSYLLVSGNPGPGIADPKMRYKMCQKDFIEELRILGGVPAELLENRELFDYFEPILRADFEIAENNQLGNEPAIAAPLFAMMGNREEKVDQLANWGRFTQSSFSREIMEGDHFFIHKHPQRIAAIIKTCCRTAMKLQYL